MTEISIVVPVCNEEENIDLLLHDIALLQLRNYEIIIVDDGSTDNSFLTVKKAAEENSLIKCISFSRNFGHQVALMAGIKAATGEKIVIMDGDGQHPVNLLPALLQKLDEGFDVVNTRRNKTEKIGGGKKFLSTLFYKFINAISDTKIEPGLADFKAFSKKVQASVLLFNERDIFLRGIFSWIGFKQTTVDYNAPERKFGKTKYSLNKMFAFGLKGILAFSFKPLRLAIIAGAIISLFAFAFAIFALVAYLRHDTVAGWASTIIASMLIGGTQLLAIGLLGEYIGGIFTEAKKRPLYLVDKTLNL